MPGEPKLLPCPFCGAPAVLNKDSYNFYHVRCGMNCIPSIGGYREPGLAVANWNRRAIPVEESQHVNQLVQPAISPTCTDHKCFDCGFIRGGRLCLRYTSKAKQQASAQ